ncbi:hypothetical protein AVEN_45863-1 [Araneus ventricosus]|uniref:Uncharacterized protein n=1 Tax=Araneus ventricosus TaxID=182803 RepID=A0A4Y2VEK2_ARAVE|nr:hypothetical protein AVEN_45863-1 [Araneus ventricosus]
MHSVAATLHQIFIEKAEHYSYIVHKSTKPVKNIADIFYNPSSTPDSSQAVHFFCFMFPLRPVEGLTPVADWLGCQLARWQVGPLNIRQFGPPGYVSTKDLKDHITKFIVRGELGIPVRCYEKEFLDDLDI